MSDPRCALASRQRDEAAFGTASTVRAFLLVQQEGAWGQDALEDSALPDDVAAWLRTTSRATGVRPLLIRRHGRAAEHGVRVFAAYAHHREPWLETGLLDDVGEVTGLDLAALADGRSTGLARTEAPVVLTCTHGSHDLCCAVEGRPVATALAASHPDLSWECSHLGGDRFAGNVLLLPRGLSYGRVGPDLAPAIVDGHLAGRVDRDHLRGRSGWPFAVQAAAHHLRAHLDVDGIDDLLLTGARRDDHVVTATFTVAERAWTVAVRAEHGPEAVLTCRSPRPNRPLHHALVEVRPG
ncbi:sucrase ferredoxin [Salsipaludibacter albus]|uniref:sucrase ferredoxin n=1 Tax=Salsipaludibacter albus TaxID=2849650 RepID=UPI001EE3D157|nr:sucrase ferredoxin [Salsipaludibacter albus]